MKISNTLEEYIKNNIFPIYNKNDQGPKLFWKDFNRLIAYYPKLKQILINEYNSYYHA